MDQNPIELLAQICQTMGQVTEKAGGKVLENHFTAKLNDFDATNGIQLKFQLLLDGPELAKEQEHGRAVFPHKTADDILGFVAIKVKGNP
jgi:hypothetical protein